MEYPESWKRNATMFESLLRFYWHNGYYDPSVAARLASWALENNKKIRAHQISFVQVQSFIRAAVTKEWKRPWIMSSTYQIDIKKAKYLEPIAAPFLMAASASTQITSVGGPTVWVFRRYRKYDYTANGFEYDHEGEALWAALVENLKNDPIARRTRRIPDDVPPLTLEQILKENDDAHRTPG